MKEDVKIFSGLNVLLGAWLILAPFVLRYSHMLTSWISGIVGAIVMLLAGIRVVFPARMPGLSWVNAALGLWLIAAPLLLRFSTRSGSNDLLIGTALAVIGSWSALITPPQNT